MLSIEPARSRAVLIGASCFASAELPALPAVRNGVRVLGELLRDPKVVGFPRSNISVLLDETDLPRIGAALYERAREAEDCLLVYYAGHGCLGRDSRDLYLAVPITSEFPEATAIDVRLVRSAMTASTARKKILIIDCCFSARALGHMGSSDMIIAASVDIQGVFAIASSPRNKPSMSPPAEEFTSFTGALLNTLRNGIENGRPVLWLDEIFEDVRASLVRRNLPEPQRLSKQDGGCIALAWNNYRSVQAPALKSLPAERTDIAQQAFLQAHNVQTRAAPNDVYRQSAVKRPISTNQWLVRRGVLTAAVAVALVLGTVVAVTLSTTPSTVNSFSVARGGIAALTTHSLPANTRSQMCEAGSAGAFLSSGVRASTAEAGPGAQQIEQPADFDVIGLRVVLPEWLTEGDHVEAEVKSRLPAWLIVLYVDDAGAAGIVWPSKEEPEPLVAPSSPAKLPSARETARGLVIRAKVRHAGTASYEKLVVYAFCEKRDFDRLKPRPADLKNGPAYSLRLARSLSALRAGRWAKTVMNYQILPKR